jgi:peptidoglycan/xylan/chitin deacetylase (PgdA/CDA1 family)
LSEQPQAVSIGHSYVADGEELVTRLYAKTVGKGRLVWLDFEPVSDDNTPDINPVRLDSVVASIFRYLSRQPYSTIASWPDGKRFAGIIVEDTEDNFLNAETVVDLFQEKGYPITWYILSNEALKQRRLTRKMAQVGEIACHGDNHSLFTNSGFEKQVERIARCQKALEAITGVKPLAFRPPEEKHNKFTIDAIANNDMTHFIANQMEDRAVPEIYVSESDRKSLVSIPRVVSDDHEIWQTRSLDYQNTVRLMQEEVELVYRIGGIYMFGFHNQFIKDKERMDAVMFLAEKLTAKNAFFSTSKDVAEWWRLRSAMLRGRTVDTSLLDRYTPMQLTVESDGVLTYSALKYSNE